ncbi:MAG: tetratricopeptide repeat protein [Alphaproteobacteria bacterium]|nr:tetratricopeptide repeat protein [Alphaproteobacteria bacterium]
MTSGQQNNLTPQQATALAAQLTQAGRLAEAEGLCRKVVAAAPGFHPALFQLALIALQVGKLPVAAELIAQAAQLAPQHAPYQTTLCEVCRRMGRLDAALDAGKKAVETAPHDSSAWYNLGVALAQSGQAQDALAAYRRATVLDPANGLAANNLGTLLEKSGDIDGAQKAYAQAVRINPKHFEAQNNLGAVLCERGELPAAIEAFENAIAANPGFVHAHYNLSSLKKYTPDDAHLKALEEISERANALTAMERMRFAFALGKALEDVGRYDEAFAAYETGNKLKRREINYNEANVIANTDSIIAACGKEMMQNAAGGCPDDTPIFILGMPRSGTTLTEQILSSHSAVAGAGEVPDLADAIEEVTGLPAGADYSAWLATADDAALKRIGESYVARLRRRHPEAKRITDKMPGNYYFIGIIHKALPNAKIIHTPRDAMDTCLSNYARLFNETMPFAYDLRELGHYYANYARLMAHWHRVLPEGRILDARYEDTVADQEGQTRRLLAHCGLDWEDACLDFHKNDRLVKTASIAQVRKPIYKTSVARWERFGKKLDPLRAALDEPHGGLTGDENTKRKEDAA